MKKTGGRPGKDDNLSPALCHSTPSFIHVAALLMILFVSLAARVPLQLWMLRYGGTVPRACSVVSITSCEKLPLFHWVQVDIIKYNIQYKVTKKKCICPLLESN